MKHIIKYRFLLMVRHKSHLFWCLLFPIILMSMFGLVLTNSYSYSKFETVPIVVEDSAQWQQNIALQTVLKDTKTTHGTLFDVRVASAKEAKKLLQDEKVSAYIECKDSIAIHVNSSGFNQTITQTFFDEYLQKSSMIQQLLAKGASMEEMQRYFTKTINYIDENEDKKTNVTNVYFYSALAMSAMFGGMWAVTAIIDIQADQSQKGARMSMAPTNKLIHLGVSLCLNLLFEMVFLSIQFLYIFLLFDINFHDQYPIMFLILLVGDIGGSALGTFIGSIVSSNNPESKHNLLSSVTMLGSFLSGMMVVQLKWIISHYAPIINYVNPVSMITDALYSLYYYGIGERVWFNIASLLIFSFLCYMISFFVLSKKQYKTLGVR